MPVLGHRRGVDRLGDTEVVILPCPVGVIKMLPLDVAVYSGRRRRDLQGGGRSASTFPARSRSDSRPVRLAPEFSGSPLPASSQVAVRPSPSIWLSP